MCEAEEKARAAVAAAGLALARPRRAAAVAVKRRRARGADMMWWCLQGRARTGNGRRWVGGGVACVQGVCRDGLSERRVCVFGRGCLEKDGDAEGRRSEEVAPGASGVATVKQAPKDTTPKPLWTQARNTNASAPPPIAQLPQGRRRREGQHTHASTLLECKSRQACFCS